MQHDGIEMAVTARVDLDGGRRAGCGPVRVDRCSDVPVDGRDRQFPFQAQQSLFDE